MSGKENDFEIDDRAAVMAWATILLMCLLGCVLLYYFASETSSKHAVCKELGYAKYEYDGTCAISKQSTVMMVWNCSGFFKTCTGVEAEAGGGRG